LNPRRLAAEEPWLLGLVGLVLVINFISMPALRYDGDAIASEMAAESLVYRGHLSVPTAIAENLPPGNPYFVFNLESGFLYSKYGVGNTLLFAIPIALERIVSPVRDFDPVGQIFGGQHGVYQIDRRVILFNTFNIFLSLGLAIILYRLAQLYTDQGFRAFAFVLACFYSTYLWNYLRAHSSQLFQVLFFSIALFHLLRYFRRAEVHPRDGSRDLLKSVSSLCALCLIKTVFLPLFGVWGAAVVLVGWSGDGSPMARVRMNLRNHFGTYLRCAGLPLLLLLALLLAVNEIKFGSPIKLGYERETNLFGGQLAESIPAYLGAPRYSIFLHFPLLAIALAAIPRFWRRYPYDFAVTWACFAVMFGIYANYTYWMGEASYGPRYLLFGLPALSLPIVTLFERSGSSPPSWQRIVPIAALSFVLLGSSLAQIAVNRLEFHVFFRLRSFFQRMDSNDRGVWDYFRYTNSAQFNRDFLRYRNTRELPEPLRDFESRLAPDEAKNLEATILPQLGSNHFFWERETGRSGTRPESIARDGGRDDAPDQDSGSATPIPPTP
jgi:hypothetical protein